MSIFRSILFSVNQIKYDFPGHGTRNSPFLISNFDDWQLLEEKVRTDDPIYNNSSVYYAVLNDFEISNNWNTAIGTSISPFKANINGRNHIISSLNNSLFGYAGGGNISNLNASTNELTISNPINFGSIVNNVTSNLTIANCTSTVKITTTINNATTDVYGIGGIVGYANGKVLIDNCSTTNNSSIVQTTNCIKNAAIGGIIGYNDGTESLITNCINNAYVAITSITNGCTGSWGGICGYTNNDITFSECINNREIYWGNANSGSFKNNIGGIIGASGNTSAILIENCSNNGLISYRNDKTSQYSRRGGIIGFSNTTGEVEITNCHNNASISTSESTECYSAGIAGYIENSAGLHINYCTNGNVNDIENKTISGYNVSGICAYSNVLTEIKNCINYNTISAKNYCSGILGYFNGSVITIDLVKNAGEITSSASHAGGIVGYISTSGKSVINNCLNTKEVTGANNGVGGIIGYLCGANHEDGITIINCENEGTITNSNGQAGGIVGYVYRTYINNVNGPAINCKIYNCRCDGNISGSSQTGGICVAAKGSNYSGQYQLTLDIQNCYFNGTLTQSYSRYGSVLRSSISNAFQLKFTHCYASDNNTLRQSELDTFTSSTVDNYNAARTFVPSTGLYAAKGSDVSDSMWTDGVSLVNALNSQRTEENGYRQWIVPSGSVLPTLGL